MQVKEEPEDSQNPSRSSSSYNTAAATAGGILKRTQTPAFLEKLFDILEDDNDFDHLISWQPDGNSFIIKKVNEFSETVLPKYFKHSNIQSYIRQLNMYGFSKTRHDSNHHEFTHKLFQRGRRDLLPFIRRKTQNSANTAANSTGTSALFKSTPDFTSMQLGAIGKLGKGKKPSPASLLSVPLSLSVGPGVGDGGVTTINSSSGRGGNVSDNIHNSSNNGLGAMSSEASSNGMEDDLHEYVVHARNLPFTSSPPDTTTTGRSSSGNGGDKAVLERRVEQLEHQVTALTEFSLALLQKHDELCEALQYYVENSVQSNSGNISGSNRSGCGDSPPSTMNFVSDQSNNGNESSSSSGNSDSGGGEGKNNSRSGFVGGGAASLNNNNNKPATPSFMAESSLNDIDEGGPPLKRMKSIDGSVSTENHSKHLIIPSPQKLHPTHPSDITSGDETIEGKSTVTSLKRPRERSESETSSSQRRVNFLDFQSHKLSAVLSSFSPHRHHIQNRHQYAVDSPSSGSFFGSALSAAALAGLPLQKKSFSVDLGGLEAITAAAQYLDDASPDAVTAAAAGPSKREVNWDSYSSVLLSRGNTGGALTKSISYGYEYSLLRTAANRGNHSS